MNETSVYLSSKPEDMKIHYSPTYTGNHYLDLGTHPVCLDTQILGTEGLLTQLALHAGIHHEIPAYPSRLATYHQAMVEYDKAHPDNLFHRSIEIDSIGVAKALLGWRDCLAMAGWNHRHTSISRRLDALAAIEAIYKEKDQSVARLLALLTDRLEKMVAGSVPTPQTFQELCIDLPFPWELMPEYLKPLFEHLKKLVKQVSCATVCKEDWPEKMQLMEFSNQFMAEAWLSQQNATDYDVWIHSDNKRLDNWLHMAGKPVAGSQMLRSNPQITQLFLLAIQLFQRPLNVNALLQYLYLPECPLPWKLSTRLSSTIVREGGFCSDKVVACIDRYLENEYLEEGDESPTELSQEERLKRYEKFLPFDLRDAEVIPSLVNEEEGVNLETLKEFLNGLKEYASNRAVKIASQMPLDLRIDELKETATLFAAMLEIIENAPEKISFKTLQKWAQSLYDTCDFRQYHAQVGSQQIIAHPSNIIHRAKHTLWCDFYGDVTPTLSTDFLSPMEKEKLTEQEVRLWDAKAEAEFQNFMLEIPLHMTKKTLTFVTCQRQGITELPIHPLRLQLPKDIVRVDGDAAFAQLPSTDIRRIDNRRAEDAIKVTFDAKNHPVPWRDQESFSSLQNLLQNPLDYFLNYTLGFSDKGLTEINMTTTLGNVAHEAIEELFTTYKGEEKLVQKVRKSFDSVFLNALAKKGALLLLPENHLDRDKLSHQLHRCVIQLAEIMETNQLTLVQCEQNEEQDLGFESGITIKGYIDMVLEDENKNLVVFDLKWTSSKDKFSNLIKENRATQLAIYQAMLKKYNDPSKTVRTAFFVMPEGKLVTSDSFAHRHHEQVVPEEAAEILPMLQKGYEVRRAEISGGTLETADNLPIDELEYAQTEGVFPLEQKGKRINKKNVKVKEENKYSDYKCFTL